ncbi:class I SAM-dependent methyltransferase, partial [Chloroflexota bacterium]
MDVLGAKTLERLKPRDRDFLERVRKTPSTVYEARIRAIDFVGKERVLDAGCGFGQWSAALASTNGQVLGVDFSDSRVHVAESLWRHFPNLSFLAGNVEGLPLSSESMDAVFSYSVIYFADPAKVVREMHRVLKPQGRMYIC